MSATLRRDVASASATVLLVVGIVGLLAIAAHRLVEWPLDCADDERLARSWIRRYLAQLALAQVPVGAGLVGSLVSDSPWVFLLGLAIAVLGALRVAPTRERLDRDAHELAAEGCSRLLLSALRGGSRSPG